MGESGFVVKKAPLLGLDTRELRAVAVENSASAYRGSQLADWLYRKGARGFQEMTNLPSAFVKCLGERYSVWRSSLVQKRRGADGTFKLLLKLSDGATVETVGLPSSDRFTCCVSTQVGCPVGCLFCATGRSGYERNLTSGEIGDQVLTVDEQQRIYVPVTAGKHGVDHVTFMGMGEPLLNYDQTMKAVRLLNSEMGIAMRHLTLSTVGYVPGIRKLIAEKLQLTLAVSLHAPTDALRRKLVPGMSAWSVADIVEACRDYVEQTGRRVTFEYCLLRGVNDGVEEVNTLVNLLKGLNCHVNLIPFNPVRGLIFRPPSAERVQGFRDILESKGIPVTQRMQRGPGIDAACGQLRRRVTSP
jgi:23S rRNA (adenine2503-C2)-methyltransferase